MRKVVITGVGVVSGIGNNANEFWTSLSAGRSGISQIVKTDVTGLRFQNAAEVKNYDPTAHFDEKTLLWLDPFAQFGIVAARESIADSGIQFSSDLQDMTGVITGSCLGGKTTEDEQFRQLYGEKRQRHPPT